MFMNGVNVVHAFLPCNPGLTSIGIRCLKSLDHSLFAKESKHVPAFQPTSTALNVVNARTSLDRTNKPLISARIWTLFHHPYLTSLKVSIEFVPRILRDLSIVRYSETNKKILICFAYL